MRALSFCAVAAAFVLTGCVSVVTVKKAKDDTQGIRYFLPEVFIQVTPATDGTITVEKVYLPDPKREYAISADSYLSSHTLEVERDEKGLLKSVTFNSDSTAVGQQLVTSAAAVRAAQIDAKAAKAKADAEQAKAAADKAKTALDAADTARKAAAATLDAAQRKVDFLQQVQNPPADIAAQILAAKLAVVDAQAKKDAADAAYNELLAKTQAPDTKAANAGAEASWPQAMDPVFYRVVMTATTVKLKQAFDQQPRATFVIPKTDSAPDLAVFPASIAVRPADKTGTLSKSVHLTLEAKAVATKSFTRPSDGKALSDVPVLSLQPGGTTIDVEIPKTTPAGHYELEMSITPASAKPADPPVTKVVKIWIEK